MNRTVQAVPMIEPNGTAVALGRYATLNLLYDDRVVDVEFNLGSAAIRASNLHVDNLMGGVKKICADLTDPMEVRGAGNRLIDEFFRPEDARQIPYGEPDLQEGAQRIPPDIHDLYIYYPAHPDELGLIPFELFHRLGNCLGVTRLLGKRLEDGEAAPLHHVLASYRLPDHFKMLIIVSIDQRWEDVDRVLNEWLERLPERIEPEVYLSTRATPARVKNLVARGDYDAIYFLAHHHDGKLVLHGRGAAGKLALKELNIKGSPLVFLNACESGTVASGAVRNLLENEVGFIIGTLHKVDAVEAIKFGGLFFDAAIGSVEYRNYLAEEEHFNIEPCEEPLPVARALAWTRRCFDTRSLIGWSYVLFGQPNAKKLEKLFQDAAKALSLQGRWKEFVMVQANIRPVEQVRSELKRVVGLWAEELFKNRQWNLVINGLKNLQDIYPDAAQTIERAEKALRADQLVDSVRKDLEA